MKTKHNALRFIVLGLSALLCSRLLFALIEDPEGPNLLVVFMGALPLCITAVATLRKTKRLPEFTRVFLAICSQVVAMLLLYLLLR